MSFFNFSLANLSIFMLDIIFMEINRSVLSCLSKDGSGWTSIPPSLRSTISRPILIFRMVDVVSASVVSNQSINFIIICYIHQWYLINRQTPPRIFTYFFIHLLSDKVGLVVVVKYTLISWIMDLMQSQREYETARIGNQRIECENELTLFGSDTSYSM